MLHELCVRESLRFFNLHTARHDEERALSEDKVTLRKRAGAEEAQALVGRFAESKSGFRASGLLQGMREARDFHENLFAAVEKDAFGDGYAWICSVGQCSKCV